MPLLKKIVKEAVDGAQKERRNWQNVGKDVDEFTKYIDIIDAYSELEMPKKCSKFLPLYALYGGYTPEQWLYVAKIVSLHGRKIIWMGFGVPNIDIWGLVKNIYF
jgi:hypothetical protein